jgi:aminoglycoside phosphotransferase (APT) family kinase protein
MHADQVDVPVDVVRRLVADQFPQWRRLPLDRVASAGMVNAVFRIGDDLTARLALQAGDPVEVRSRLQSEAAAATELAACSPVPTPLPVALAAPGHGYPLPWAVQTWLPGRDATAEDPATSIAFARDLAGFIAALRAVDSGGRRFSGQGRGGSLPDHDGWLEVCLRESEGLLDVPRLRRLWRTLRGLPAGGPDVMSHGDLVPGNVLVCGGRLAGVLDGGGFGPADPALDLVSGWHLLDGPREVLRSTLACTQVEWERGMAWAFQQAMGLVWYYAASNPSVSRLGRRTLDRILAQGPGPAPVRTARGR